MPESSLDSPILLITLHAAICGEYCTPDTRYERSSVPGIPQQTVDYVKSFTLHTGHAFQRSTRATASISVYRASNTQRYPQPVQYQAILLLEYYNIIVLFFKLWVTFIRKKISSRTVLNSPQQYKTPYQEFFFKFIFYLFVLKLLRAHFIPTVGVRKRGEY